MATRQYIGARYVPKFYQNSVDGSAQWESNVVYEPLTFVTLTNSHMYISKKQVPATIGSPVNNIDYWLDVGSYNGFIEQLQDEIDTINGTLVLKQNTSDNTLSTTDKTVVGAINEVKTGVDNNTTALATKQDKSDNTLTTTAKTVVGAINELDSDIQNLANDFLAAKSNPWHNKDVVVYGDSLSTIQYEYWQYMQEYDSTINVTNRAVGGTRIQDGVTLLQAATDLNDFDIIVLAYGTNSWANTSMRGMLDSYVEAFNIIANKAPTKEVIVIAPPYAHNDAYANNGETNNLRWHIADYANNICAIANMYGHKAYNLYQICGVNNFNYTSYMSDGGTGIYVHQNELLGRRMANALLNDSYYSSTATTFTFISADGTSTSRGFMVTKYGNHIDLQQRGSMTVAELQALDLEHIAPAPLATSFFRDTNGNMGWASLSYDGTLNLSWNGTEGVNVQGLHFSGIIGNYE